MIDSYVDVVAQAHIAIVDDDAATCVAMLRSCRAEGFAVVAYQGAKVFLRLGGHHEAVCLILDMQMSDMSGLELQDYLRRSGYRQPIVLLTANDDAAIRNLALNQGAFRVLRKPPAEYELLEAIHAALRLADCAR